MHWQFDCTLRPAFDRRPWLDNCAANAVLLHGLVRHLSQGDARCGAAPMRSLKDAHHRRTRIWSRALSFAVALLTLASASVMISCGPNSNQHNMSQRVPMWSMTSSDAMVGSRLLWPQASFTACYEAVFRN